MAFVTVCQGGYRGYLALNLIGFHHEGMLHNILVTYLMSTSINSFIFLLNYSKITYG